MTPTQDLVVLIFALVYLGMILGGLPWLHLDIFAWNGESKPGRPIPGASNLNGTGVGAAAFEKLVVQGVQSVMGLLPFCTQ